jgi:hypothetical protein
MRADNALCSSAALINSEYPAKFAGNSAMKWRSRGRGFKSTLLHISVCRVLDIAENRPKSARVRAICDHPRTRRISAAAQNTQNLAKALWAGFA